MEVYPQEGDLIQFIKLTLEPFKVLVQDKGISLLLEVNGDEGRSKFDKQKLKIVIDNLLSNAVKFTPEKGDIKVHVEFKNSNLSLSVEDNGKGISQEDLGSIFERYYQGTNHESGTGIGLSLSNELVRLMGGVLMVESILGNGTKFTMELPVESAEELVAASEILNGNGTEENMLEILIIEDNHDIQKYLGTILGGENKLLFADNGVEGIRMAIESIPDIIISDVMMPDSNGFEVVNKLKNTLTTNHIPIILLTARNEMDARLYGLKVGADAYLNKPFHEDELVLTIRNLIELREKLKEKYSVNGVDDNSEIQDELISSLSEYVMLNLSSESMSMDDISRELGVSRSQLHRKLVAVTGVSATAFINDIRLNEAYKKLSKGLTNVSEVAYEVGYSDPAYFSKLFRKKYSVAPSKVKELN